VDCGDGPPTASPSKSESATSGRDNARKKPKSTIDKERVAAVKAMEALGYCFDGLKWNAPDNGAVQSLIDEADAMHGLLVLRADKLEGCTEGSDEEGELKLIADTVKAYEAKRWANGAVPGGKGE